MKKILLLGIAVIILAACGNNTKIENEAGKTGIGRNYVIIPMKVTALYNGKKLTNTGEIMIFKDEGKWYIINYDKD